MGRHWIRAFILGSALAVAVMLAGVPAGVVGVSGGAKGAGGSGRAEVLAASPKQSAVRNQGVGKDYVQVGPNGQYLQLDGKPFIPIGFNDAVSWGNLLFLYNDMAPEIVQDYFAKLHHYGINTLRIMVSYSQDPSGQYELEKPLGHFQPEMVALWDQVFKLADQYHIYLILTPWDPFWMSRTWDADPWNVKNGGPVQDLSGMLTDPKAIQLEKQEYAFVIDRYGKSKYILAWELANEIDLWFRGTRSDSQLADAIRVWTTDMAQFIRDREMQKYGARHLITISTANPDPDGFMGRAIYDNPALDFVTTHMYYGPVKDPTTPVEAAQAVQDGMAYQLYKLGGKKPYLDSESGPIDRWPLSKDEDLPYYHAMVWAAMMSGAAGPGLRWPYTQSSTLDDDYYTILGAVAKYVQGVPWTTERWRTVGRDNLSLEDEADLNAFGLIGREHAVLWFLPQTDKGTQAPSSVTLQGLVAGHYMVEYWDTWKGSIVRTTPAQATASGLTLQLPAMAKDLALKVHPAQ